MILMTIIATSKSQELKCFHDFTVKSIDGKEVDLVSYKGKKVLVVNTASKCGLTPQYEQLQALYEEYGGDDFVIIGFPANNFLWQEPGSNEEIQEFCTVNYGVSFPMMAKISVKGKNIHPIYAWLTSESQNGVMDSKVNWSDKDSKKLSVTSDQKFPPDRYRDQPSTFNLQTSIDPTSSMHL